MTEHNRDREIRDLLDGRERSINRGVIYANELWLIERLREILYRPSPSTRTPRVFFPGETVPKGVAVTMMAPLPESGDEHVYVMHEATWDYSVDPGYPVVELITPSPQAWQATVDRAKAARADSEWQHTEGVNP